MKNPLHTLSQFALGIAVFIASPAHASKSVEPELCYQKILSAYETFSESGTFVIKDKTCETYLDNFKDHFFDTHLTSDIAFSGTPIEPIYNSSGRAFATRFKIDPVNDVPSLSSVTIYHAVPNFHFYPGPHWIEARRSETGHYVNEWVKHGEIISDAELKRKAFVKQRREHIGHSVEPELCYQKIKQAYDAQEAGGAFILKDQTCLKYKARYDSLYRIR